MTTLTRKFTDPATTAAVGGNGSFLGGTSSSAGHKQQGQPSNDSSRRADPQARVITPPISPPGSREGGTTRQAGTLGGLALLSAAVENQAVEDIIDESLKDFDLATCTKNLQSFKTV